MVKGYHHQQESSRYNNYWPSSPMHKFNELT